MTFEASHIEYRIGRTVILKGVSLTLTPGKLTVLAGPNGAGKSSLLKIFSGEIKPQSGTVTLFDKSLTSFSIAALARVRSVLSQKLHVAFPFTAEEVVGLSLQVTNMLQADIQKIVEAVMIETGVDHLRARLYPTLSGGEQQRVQLARALAQIWEDSLYPRFLLLDEPTNNLDITHQQAILSTAKSLTHHKLGVMAIVHDLNLAAQYADTIVFIKDGGIYAQGEPVDVITRENIEDVFAHPVSILYDQFNKPVVVPTPSYLSFKNTSLKIKTHGTFDYSES